MDAFPDVNTNNVCVSDRELLLKKHAQKSFLCYRQFVLFGLSWMVITSLSNDDLDFLNTSVGRILKLSWLPEKVRYASPQMTLKVHNILAKRKWRILKRNRNKWKNGVRNLSFHNTSSRTETDVPWLGRVVPLLCSRSSIPHCSEGIEFFCFSFLAQ